MGSFVESFKGPVRNILTVERRRQLRYKLLSRIYRSDLTKLAELYQTDKTGSHYYTPHYQSHFEKLRNNSLNLLEIGIGGYDDPVAGGNSLRMWKAFFPKGRIYGLDIYDKSRHDENRIKTFRGSQIDEQFLIGIVKEIGKVDIIIDDGSHVNDHVISTFKILFPMLDTNGIYVIEDTQTSYWDTAAGQQWGGSTLLDASHTTMNFLKGLIDGLNYEEFIHHYEPSYFDRHVVGMHFYHNLVFIMKGINNEGSNLARISG